MHLLIKSGAVYFTACSLAIWNKKVKILVTGGAGFIGSAVVRHIINNTQDSVVNVGNDSNLLIVFYVQIMPDDFVMQLHRF
ncbi:hypothetical protein BFD21_00020 [Escherichia coli]|nr:hypothetical protein BFD21_00020 [Escherichia coli]